MHDVINGSVRTSHFVTASKSLSIDTRMLEFVYSSLVSVDLRQYEIGSGKRFEISISV